MERDRRTDTVNADSVDDVTWKWKIIIIIAFTAFGVGTVTAVGYGMHGMKCTGHTDEKEKLRQQYRYLYQTEEQAKKRVAELNDASNWQRVQQKTTSNSVITCTNGTNPGADGSKKGVLAEVHHACCLTIFHPRRFQTIYTVEDELVMISDLMSGSGHYQYFFVETCGENADCHLPCACMVLEHFQSALVTSMRNGEEWIRLESVKFTGNCKCVNRVRTG